MKNDEVRPVGYIRVSTEEQAKLGGSIEVQENKIESYCQNRGWPLYTQHIDDGFSGTDFVNRPALNRLREDARAGLFNTVICSRLDRLGRDGAELITLIFKEFKQNGIRCIFIDDGLDSFEDRDRLVIYIRCEQAEAYRERFLQISKESKILRAKQGRNVGGVAPIGWELDRATHILRKCLEEAALVEVVIQLYQSGHGFTQIARHLNEIAWPPIRHSVRLPAPRFCTIIGKEKRTDRCYLRPAHSEYKNHCLPCIESFNAQENIEIPNGFGRSTIRRIICQELGAGRAVWGRTTTIDKKRVPVDPELHIVADEITHDPLFDEDTKARLKQIREDNRIKSPRTQTGGYLLTGFMYCECGSRMTGHTDGDKWKAYFCCTRKCKGKVLCDAPTLNVNKIHPYIEERLREFVASIEDESFFESDSWIEDSAVEVNLRKSIKQIELDIFKNEKDSEKVLSLFLQDNQAPVIVRGRLEELEGEKKELERQLSERHRQLQKAQQDKPSKEQLIEVAKDFNTVWDGADMEDKKRFVKMLIDRITVYKDGRIEVQFAV